MATRKNHLFKFRRILLPVTAAENRFSSYPAVYFRSLLRRKFVFLHFHRTLAPCSTAGILLSSFPPYTCALSYGRISPFFISRRTLVPYSTAGIHFFISLPYTCAFFYGRNSPFFISTVHLRFTLRRKFIFSFPTVHLRHFLRQKLPFLHFQPYTSILSCRRISPPMAFTPKSLQKILLLHFPYCHIKNYFLRQLFSTSNPGKFTPASYLTPGKLSSQRLPAPPGR